MRISLKMMHIQLKFIWNGREKKNSSRSGIVRRMERVLIHTFEKFDFKINTNFVFTLQELTDFYVVNAFFFAFHVVKKRNKWKKISTIEMGQESLDGKCVKYKLVACKNNNNHCKQVIKTDM